MPSPRDVIDSDPEIMGGTPVFTGTRVPVQSLFDYLAAGDPLKDFLEAFPTVTLRQEKAALEMAKGALEAAADLQSGKLELKRWGTPAREVPVFEELLKHHLGVAMSVAAGCVIDPVQEAGWIAYNEVMEREIEQRFGKGAIDRVWNESETVYRERSARQPK